MKKIFSVILSSVMCVAAICGAAACSSTNSESEKKDPSENTQNVDPDNKTEDTSKKEEETPKDEPKGYDEAELKEQFLSLANEVVVSEDSVTFTDASGADSVTVAKNPQNVYNLYGSFTTLWYEAGGTVSGCIGGKSSVALYTEYIGRDITQDEGMNVVATSSSGSKWSVETIISGKPDLIICSTAMSGYKTISGPAAEADIPVIAVSYNNFEDYLKWFKVFCNLSGHEDLWDSVAMKALDDVVDVLMEIPLENNPKIFSIFSNGTSSLQANLSTTVVGDMAKMMRATNIADSWYNETGAQRLDINLETVYSEDPDMILVQCHDEEDVIKEKIATEYGENPIWNSLSAVKNDKVYYLQKSLFHNKPNRKFAEAYQIMATLLYPDVEFSFLSK